jgi:uncharacterized protein (UPF0332 family)
VTPEQHSLLKQASDSTGAAKLLPGGNYPGFAASRAYFAMFYVAEAFLEGEGLSFSKHSAVIAAFGRHFALPGKLPVEFYRYLMEAQDLRHSGDYGDANVVTSDEATEQIRRAEQFLETAWRLLDPNADGPKGPAPQP